MVSWCSTLIRAAASLSISLAFAAYLFLVLNNDRFGTNWAERAINKVEVDYEEEARLADNRWILLL